MLSIVLGLFLEEECQDETSSLLPLEMTTTFLPRLSILSEISWPRHRDIIVDYLEVATNHTIKTEKSGATMDHSVEDCFMQSQARKIVSRILWSASDTQTLIGELKMIIDPKSC